MSVAFSGGTMIYAKIYLDTDENGREMFVFEATPVSDHICNVSFRVRIVGAESVAISPEAKDKLLKRLNDRGSLDLIYYGGDVEFDGPGYGVFSFRPDKGEICKKTIGVDARFSVCTKNGVSREMLEYMLLVDNEVLKTLDLTTPVDEAKNLSYYYERKGKEDGGAPCDEMTIRKTPIEFMTKEQKNIVREEYSNSCAQYSDTEWHIRGEYIEEKILEEVMKKFRKSLSEIRQILNCDK